MCGIIGYLGNKKAAPILIDGLKKLEYRGYDSAGICLLEGADFFVAKTKGRVTDLESKISGVTDNLFSTIGIAHTRWATHGEPNEINAHPHLDCKKEIAVLHNGIIENHSALKEILEKEGHVFVSKTDTEVLSHLIEKFYENNLEEAVIKTLKLVAATSGISIKLT